MDYKKELKRLESGGDYFKPKESGTYKVKFLSEVEETDPLIKTVDGKEEITPMMGIRVTVDGNEKLWSFGRGKTLVSTYGQLMAIAGKNGYKLAGEEVKVHVKNDGTKNDYTIVSLE